MIDYILTIFVRRQECLLVHIMRHGFSLVQSQLLLPRVGVTKYRHFSEMTTFMGSTADVQVTTKRSRSTLSRSKAARSASRSSDSLFRSHRIPVRWLKHHRQVPTRLSTLLLSDQERKDETLPLGSLPRRFQIQAVTNRWCLAARLLGWIHRAVKGVSHAGQLQFGKAERLADVIVEIRGKATPFFGSGFLPNLVSL